MMSRIAYFFACAALLLAAFGIPALAAEPGKKPNVSYAC